MVDVIMFLLVLLGFLLCFLMMKWRYHPACLPEIKTRKKQDDVYLIRRPSYEQWCLIKDHIHDLSMKELCRISGLSRSTIYRCLRLQREGTEVQKRQFKSGKRSINSLIEEIKRSSAVD